MVQSWYLQSDFYFNPLVFKQYIIKLTGKSFIEVLMFLRKQKLSHLFGKTLHGEKDK